MWDRGKREEGRQQDKKRKEKEKKQVEKQTKGLKESIELLEMGGGQKGEFDISKKEGKVQMLHFLYDLIIIEINKKLRN